MHGIAGHSLAELNRKMIRGDRFDSLTTPTMELRR
jgi:hypothetical protein